MQDKALVDDHAVGVAAIGDASQVLIGEVVGEDHVRAELLEASLALGAGAVGIDHAAHGGEVPRFESSDRGADPGDPADDLMAWDAGIHGRHDAAPLIADLVEIGVADTAEQDLDLHVVFRWIPACDRRVGQRRCRAGSGVSLRVVHEFMLLSDCSQALIQALYCSSLTCSNQSAALPSRCS